MNKWYRLDNAAKVFPSVTNIKNSSVFRVSAILTEPIDKIILQKAVEHIYDRFPMLFVRMHKGVFWNYFEDNTEKFLVEEERFYPCCTINRLNNNGYFLKVLYYGNRISIELFHSLTDGGGALEFLKSLLYYYLVFCGKDVTDDGKIILAQQGVQTTDTADSFSAYYEKSKKKSQKSLNAYRVKGTNFDCYGTNVLSGIVEVDDISAAAKKHGATITSFITALFIFSIYQGKQKYSYSQKPIVVAVPVNLRRTFPSTTLRNFFGVVNISITPVKSTTFHEIVLLVEKQLKEKTMKDALQHIISANINLERNSFSRFIPLPLKNLIILLGFNFRGEVKKSTSISNFGTTNIPESMGKFILHSEAVLYPTKKSPINCGIISHNSKLTISFSRTIVETDIIKYFFSHLSEKENISVEIYSNEWGDQFE